MGYALFKQFKLIIPNQYRRIMIYTRDIKPRIQKWISQGKVLIVYGARQVGKTTLVKEIATETGIEYKYINCDYPSQRQSLEIQEEASLKGLIGNYKLVLIDEAQRVKNIGITIKILHDLFPEVQFIVTGSSSFDLANEINEPMTGRVIDFKLHPLSLKELNTKIDLISLDTQLENIMQYGLYPDIYSKDYNTAEESLINLANNYLYKDILNLDRIKKSNMLSELLIYLSNRIGQELSYYGIQKDLKNRLDASTIERYIDALEKCFVITRLRPYHRNIGVELTKPFKIYFWDLGISNAVTENFFNLKNRGEDVGHMWENLVIIERMKKNMNAGIRKQYYFWRTTDQKKYDFLEVTSNHIDVLEVKWSQTKSIKIHEIFAKHYPESTVNIVNKENWMNWLV